MSNYVRNFDVKNYYRTTVPQLIANNMSGCFFETRCMLFSVWK